jgi:hypothetical protein
VNHILANVQDGMPESVRIMLDRLNQVDALSPISAGVLDTTSRKEVPFKWMPFMMRSQLAAYDYPERQIPSLHQLCSDFISEYANQAYDKLDEGFSWGGEI